MSGTVKTVPKDLKPLVNRINAVEAKIKTENGVRGVDELLEAAQIYTEFLDWVSKCSRMIEKWRLKSSKARERKGDLQKDGPVASTPGWDKWMESIGEMHEDQTPSPDELQAYMRQLVAVMEEELPLRRRYDYGYLPPGPVENMLAVFDLVISKLNMLGRLKWVNGGTVPMTEAVYGVLAILSQPGANVEQLIPPYNSEEKAVKHADDMIAAILAEESMEPVEAATAA